MDIVNKTQRPLLVPLPGGKRLHLGPGRTGQITPKAAEHPPVKALVDAGDLEIQGSGKTKASAAGGTVQGTTASQASGPTTGGVRHTGDR